MVLPTALDEVLPHGESICLVTEAYDCEQRGELE
jgi:hypothetical protein